MRKLLFIILLFFSTSVFAAKYWAPCLESSDLRMSFGPPLHQVDRDFYWFTEAFTAICTVETEEKDYCYLNKTVDQINESIFGKLFQNNSDYKLFYENLIKSEDSCQ